MPLQVMGCLKMCLSWNLYASFVCPVLVEEKYVMWGESPDFTLVELTIAIESM